MENMKFDWCIETHIFTLGYFLIDFCVCASQKYDLRVFDTVTVEVETHSNCFVFPESVNLQDLNSPCVYIVISTGTLLITCAGPHSL